VGSAAKRVIGRAPGNIVATQPLKDGVIADIDVTEKMLSYFIRQARSMRRIFGLHRTLELRFQAMLSEEGVMRLDLARP
jgi:actin-like ATPase involved in cell morphogenesis